MRRVVPFKKFWQKALYRVLCGLLAVCCVACVSGRALIHAQSSGVSPAWASPSAAAVKRVSDIDAAQHQPNFLSNLDCTLLTYRMVASSTMQTGCFTPTAFGLLDSDSETIIFNGTDEALPLKSYSPGQALVPWPSALNVLALDAANTGGSYLSMYSNPLANLQSQRGALGQLTAKQIGLPPDIVLKDQSGQRLIVNAQTLAFSSGGSWLVAETLGGSFVRINLASLDMTAFAQAFGAQGSPGALLKSQVAISDDGRYAAIANTVAASLKVYDLATCGGNVTSWQTSGCQSHEYWPFESQQISGLQSIRHVRFINDGLLSFEATSSNSANSGVYEFAPTSSITSLTDYIGLGDSYTSGEGAFDYLDGTDTADNSCHLSANSYPLLLSRALFSATGGHSVACSGAVINDVAATSASYRGQVKHGESLADLEQHQPAFLDAVKADYTPGYIAQQAFVKQYQPGVITVSIGGNDIGFGDMLQNCVEPHLSRHTSDSTCYDTYEDRLEMTALIDRTVPRWTALYKQLQTESPQSRIYAIGYPSIASDTGTCGPNVLLGKGELEFAEELIAYLDNAIRQAASSAGVSYVDISQALAGHRLCEAGGGGAAVNGLTFGNDSGLLGINILGKESYHPNALGHQIVEQAILKQTNNLANRAPQTSAANPPLLLDAPKTNRSINALTPDDSMMPTTMTLGSTNTLSVSGVRDGLQPKASYTVRLDGPAGPAVSTLTSDASGDITGQVTIPDTVEPGSHTVGVFGANEAGEPAEVTETVYIGSMNPVSPANAAGQISLVSPASPDNSPVSPVMNPGATARKLSALSSASAKTQPSNAVQSDDTPAAKSPTTTKRSSTAGHLVALLNLAFINRVAGWLTFIKHLVPRIHF